MPKIDDLPKVSSDFFGPVEANGNKPQTSDDTIPDGKRNTTLTHYAGKLRRIGLEPAEIDDALQAMNARRCDPPLPPDEVSTIAASIGQCEAAESVKAPGLVGAVLLGQVIQHGIEPPEMLIDAVLYAAGIHSIYGPPGVGKSILALWMCLQVMEQGRPILYIDEENNARKQAARLKAMGAEPAEIDRLFHYRQSPGLSLDEDSIADLVADTDAIKPALVVFDSWADFLALEGLNENDSVDVTKWILNAVYPLRDWGAAVLLIDHVTKDGEGKGGRGSGAELAKLDAAYKVEPRKLFDRDTTGTVRLRRDIDRDACLEARITFTIGGDGNGRLICHPACDDEEPIIGGFTFSEIDVLDALRDALKDSPEGLGSNAWWKLTSIKSKGVFTTIRNSLYEKGLSQ